MLTLNSEIALSRPEAPALVGVQAFANQRLPSEHVTLHLDDDVLRALRATGKDWEARFNAILREWLHDSTKS